MKGFDDNVEHTFTFEIVDDDGKVTATVTQTARTAFEARTVVARERRCEPGNVRPVGRSMVK